MKITKRQLRQIIKEETTSLVNESPPGVCFSRIQLMMNPEEFAGMEPPKGDPCYDEWEQNYTDMGGIVDDESGVQLARPDDRKPKKESLNYESSRLAKIISEEIEKELKKKESKEEVEKAVEDVKRDNVKMKINFEKLMKTGYLDISLSNGKNLKLSGNPAAGDLSFKLTKLGNEKNVFLKGSLEDAFNEKKKVMVKLGVKI